MRTLLFAGLVAYAASPSGAQVPLTLDTSFRASRITHPGLTDALPLEDGSVITNGDCILDSFVWNNYGWMKLLSNGAIDETFGMSRGSGSIFATENYYYIETGGGVRRKFLDGTSDAPYHIGTANSPVPGTPSGAYGDVFVQEDGHVLMSGDMLMGDFWDQPAGWYSLMRINPNARLDSTYDHRQADHAIWTLEPLANGQLLASGVFNVYEGDSVGRIIRIDQDGTRDTTYRSPIRNGYAKSFIHQPDGKIIAGGLFVLENDPDTTHLIRLLPNGALDSTFNNHTEYKRLPYLTFGDFAHGINDIEALADGTIIVGGNFTHINGELRRGIALVDSLGNLLNTAFTGEGCGLCHALNSTYMQSGISAISPAPDGSIFLSGAFWGFDDGVINDPGQRMICKLHGLPVGVAEVNGNANGVLLFPNPGDERLTIQLTDANARSLITIRDAQGRSITTQQVMNKQAEFDTRTWATGLYVVEVQLIAGLKQRTKWIKQ
jgi:Domain of unknown function (DUF5122) beta-propeller/Secretion system C-terminal sorting domain